MNTIETRRKHIQDLRSRGIAIPNAVLSDIEKDRPRIELRDWPWWAAIWERPRADSWEFDERGLELIQASWDAGKRHVDAQNELHAEREARKQQQREQRDQQDASRKAAELAVVTAELRRSYLSQPGTTPEGFEKALPELLEQRARQAALAGTQSQAQANVRSTISYV